MIISLHYNDVIIGMIASQITSLTIVYLIVYSEADRKKHQSSASLAFVRGIHRGPVNSLHKWPVTRKFFHLMTSSCITEFFSDSSNCLACKQVHNKFFRFFHYLVRDKICSLKNVMFLTYIFCYSIMGVFPMLPFQVVVIANFQRQTWLHGCLFIFLLKK